MCERGREECVLSETVSYVQMGLLYLSAVSIQWEAGE